MKSDISNLSYVNRANIYYFMMDGCVYAVNLETESCRVIVSGLREGCYHVSESNKMLVWQEGQDPHAGSRLVLMNLNTQGQTSIEAGTDEYISILGFMDEDMIYGLTRQRDIAAGSSGAALYPMYCVHSE